MNRVFLILTGLLLLYSTRGLVQCPDPDSTWRKLEAINATLNKGPAELRELQGLLNSLAKCGRTNDSIYARALYVSGATYWKTGDYLNALKYCRQAIAVTRDHAGSPAVSERHLIDPYYRISAAYDSLDNVPGRQEALDSCIAISTRLNSVGLICLWSLLKRTEHSFDIGDYQRCIEYGTRCRKMGLIYAQSKVPLADENGAWYASTGLLRQVSALLILKEYDRAGSLLLDEIRRRDPIVMLRNGSSLFGQMAQVEIAKKNYQQAVSYYQKALECARTEKNFANCKTILNNIGFSIYLEKYHEPDKALFFLRKALDVDHGRKMLLAEDSIERLNVLESMAECFVVKKAFDSAYHYFNQAMNYIGPGITEENILSEGLPRLGHLQKIRYVTELFIGKGNACLADFKANRRADAGRKAIRVYKCADQLLNQIKASQLDMQSKLFWREDTRELYENAIEACLLMGLTEEAFYFFEKSRAVLLKDQLNEQRWVDEADIFRQVQIRKRIQQLTIDLKNTDKSSPKYKAMEDELFTNKEELDRLINIIRSNNPLYYRSFIDTSVVRVRDVQQSILVAHRAMVEIFAGKNAVYAMIIYPDRVLLHSLPKAAFDRLTDQYIRFFKNADQQNKDFGNYVSVASQLYQLIFRDASLPAGRIIISPDGPYFPFESLVTNQNTEANPRYLIYDHAVSYAYSAGYLLHPFPATQASSSAGFLGLAPVHYANNLNLSSLGGSDFSLKKIGRLFAGSDLLTADQASKSNFLNEFFKYRIVQLYTHAKDSSRQGEPVIYFADSAMYLSELASRNKPLTSLVVLSACETGLGEIYQGEGVFNFNRAFAALGIPSSVSNLWSVDNQSTYRLNELFFKYLAGGLASDLALQKAKLEFIETASREHQLPFFWAAPVIMGKTDAVRFPGQPRHAYLFLVSFSFVFLAAMYLVFRAGESLIRIQKMVGIAG